MKLSLHRAEDFNTDFDQQYRWYLEKAGEELAERFLAAVLATLISLTTQPDLGRRRKFRHPALRNLYSFRVTTARLKSPVNRADGWGQA